jgi:bifunctional NMN adenylyltransferase/nudix hydrolase
MKYDLLVYIGRFQPLHRGHQEVIERALLLSKKVLVLVGSANQARTTRNPFTYDERATLINELYPSVVTKPLQDHTYNDTAWIAEVQKQVKETLLGTGWTPDGLSDYKVGLIGCNKDATSYYLKMFPNWANESIEHFDEIDATPIRNRFLANKMNEAFMEQVVISQNVYEFMQDFMITDSYTALNEEYKYLVKYKENYGHGPFLTADALIQVGGKILLIRRGKEYGHGLLALPGGFVNLGETFINAFLRELREETNLRVPVPVLKGSIKNTFMADEPNRSARARLVSQVFHVKLENDVKLPEVRGGDDADEALWVDIADLRREDFFEDHYHIIKLMLGLN